MGMPGVASMVQNMLRFYYRRMESLSFRLIFRDAVYRKVAQTIFNHQVNYSALGEYISLGYFEQEDVDVVIDYLLKTETVSNICASSFTSRVGSHLLMQLFFCIPIRSLG